MSSLSTLPGTAGGARAVRPVRAHSDAQLIALVRAGDGDALAEIAHRYRPLMLSMAQPLLARTGHDPEDAVQDALVRAVHALRRDGRDIALRAWLAVVVRNRALDLLRRRDNAATALREDLPAARALDPADAAERREAFRERCGRCRRSRPASWRRSSRARSNAPRTTSSRAASTRRPRP